MPAEYVNILSGHEKASKNSGNCYWKLSRLHTYKAKLLSHKAVGLSTGAGHSGGRRITNALLRE